MEDNSQPNLDQMDFDGLEAVERQVQERKQAIRKQALDTVMKIIQKFNFSQGDVFPSTPGKQARPAKAEATSTASTPTGKPKRNGARKPLPAKYRDPSTGATWSGKGRPPLWFDKSRPQDFPL